MANLTTEQINELKEKGFITQVIPSADLASNTVDELKIDKFVTVTDPSANIEAAVTHEIPVSSITLNPTTTAVSKGGTVTIEATVLPEDATDPSVTWTSGDPDVALVSDEGVVTGVNFGTTTITATAGNKSATCEVTVPEDE